jgi:hypothetical protein
MAGITVDSDAASYLHVVVTHLEFAPGGRAASVQVKLQQPVTTLISETFLIAPTWDIGGVVTGPSSDGDYFRGAVKDYVDRFLNDYLKANPKQ